MNNSEACLCLRHASISTREACLLAGMLNYLIESLRQHQINCLIVLRTTYSMFLLTYISMKLPCEAMQHYGCISYNNVQS